MEKIITIGRSYGSGGRTLGRLLAEKLNIKCYSYELVRLASEKSGINEALFGKVDEKVKSRAFFGKTEHIYTGELLPPSSDKYVSDDNLFNIQAQVIRDLADAGPCIIVGRCGDFVLKDRPDVVRLFFYAPREDCIARVRYQNGGTDREIVQKIERIDKYRSEYYRYHTGRDWKDITNYDYCLNTGSLDYDTLVNAVEALINIK